MDTKNLVSSNDLRAIGQKILETLSLLNKPPFQVYTIADVAKILKCKERTVRHHLFEIKDLRYLKVGREVRIVDEDLKEFLENRLTPCVHDREILP